MLENKELKTSQMLRGTEGERKVHTSKRESLCFTVNVSLSQPSVVRGIS